MVSKFVTYSGRTLYYGLTDDVKPIDAPNGACYTDIETGDEYWFDKENDGWYAPDGSFIPNPHEDEEGDEEMFVTITYDDEQDIYSCNKSSLEINEAFTSGKMIYALLIQGEQTTVMSLTDVVANEDIVVTVFSYLYATGSGQTSTHNLVAYAVLPNKSVNVQEVVVPYLDV